MNTLKERSKTTASKKLTSNFNEKKGDGLIQGVDFLPPAMEASVFKDNKTDKFRKLKLRLKVISKL